MFMPKFIWDSRISYFSDHSHMYTFYIIVCTCLSLRFSYIHVYKCVYVNLGTCLSMVGEGRSKINFTVKISDY